MPTITILNREIKKENLPEFTRYLFKYRIKDRRVIMPKRENSQAEIKEKIQLYEIRKNGLSKTCDIIVIVKNLRIKKDEYIADIVLQEEDYTQIYSNCKYSKEIIDNIK